MIDSSAHPKRRPAIGYVPGEETLLFSLKKGMDAWYRRLLREDVDISDSLKELVWELLVLCAEYIDSGGGKPPRETYRLAAEIGRRLTERIERREAVQIFRDWLLRDILKQFDSREQAAVQHILWFFMAAGDAVWEAYAEQLRTSIRQEKRQRLTEQLRVAKRIQQHLLPKSIPEIEGFEFAGRLIPAEEVGGDYWSIKSYPLDHTITMKLADVTGHGIAAATLVAAVKFISGGFYRGSHSPAEVIERTNHVLVRETPSDILVTMIYGWLNPVTRRIRLVNAGHHPVFIAKANGFRDIPPTGPLLGLNESTYEEITERLEPGDILVFSSDGVVEAGAPHFFGVDRLKDIVWQNRERSADEIVSAILDAVQSYDVAVSDDLSVVVTKVLPEEPDIYA